MLIGNNESMSKYFAESIQNPCKDGVHPLAKESCPSTCVEINLYACIEQHIFFSTVAVRVKHTFPVISVIELAAKGDLPTIAT